MSDHLYYLTAARTKAQLDQMIWLQENGICVFCPEHFAEHHREPVAWEGEHWYATRNDYPYAGLSQHYLIVPKLHVADVTELPASSMVELFGVILAIKDLYKFESYTLLMRNGDMRQNGGSIEHAHMHLVSRDLNTADSDPVKFKVTSNPKSWDALPNFSNDPAPPS